MTLIWLFLFAFYFLFTWKAGKTYPLFYLALLVYFIQYIFSVYLIYNVYPVLGKQMTIPQDQLFEYTIPALIFLFAGIFIFNRDINIKDYIRRINPDTASKLGHLILFISFFFDFLSFVIPSLRSVISFTHFLRYVAASCYVFSSSVTNYILIGLVYISLATETLVGGVFIDFLMWSVFISLFISHKFNISFFWRFVLALLVVPLIVTIQLVKKEYRTATWNGKREAGLELLAELAEKKNAKEEEPFQSSNGVISTIGRLNQGWHLGMVLKHVPKKEHFSNGEDFLSDVAGIFLPRVFFPEKKVIGSQQKFHKFTGYKLIGNTSMTIGVLGDFYVNFGRWGSYVALFIFGSAVALILKGFIQRYVVSDPINIIWIPFLHNYFSRAGNDFYMVTNSLFKGFLIFLLINFIRKKIWPTSEVAKKIERADAMPSSKG